LANCMWEGSRRSLAIRSASVAHSPSSSARAYKSGAEAGCLGPTRRSGLRRDDLGLLAAAALGLGREWRLGGSDRLGRLGGRSLDGGVRDLRIVLVVRALVIQRLSDDLLTLERQANSECTAAAHRTLNLDTPAMQRHDFFDDVQTNSQAAHVLLIGVARAVKALK
jgi:hypothetical protein